MWAILSDIHGNLEALNAVLADIEQHRVDKIICLGDLVGYGPNPVECIDVARERFDITILGNFDQALMFDPDGYSPVAERSVFWSRDQMEQSGELTEARWEFIADLPRSHQEGRFLFVHGSARNPLHEYVFPEDIYNLRKMERILSLMDGYCFCGHTHVPGILEAYSFCDPKTWIVLENPDTQMEHEEPHWYAPEDVEYKWQLRHRKTIINVGSVGQPRDGDPRACYVLLDGRTVIFRRVDYDIETVVRKIYDVPELENFLGDRLRDGR